MQHTPTPTHIHRNLTAQHSHFPKVTTNAKHDLLPRDNWLLVERTVPRCRRPLFTPLLLLQAHASAQLALTTHTYTHPPVSNTLKMQAVPFEGARYLQIVSGLLTVSEIASLGSSGWSGFSWKPASLSSALFSLLHVYGQAGNMILNVVLSQKKKDIFTPKFGNKR